MIIMKMLKYFEYRHLPEHLQEVSKQFYWLATTVSALPEGRARDMALDKLLEAKDAAVRSEAVDGWEASDSWRNDH